VLVASLASVAYLGVVQPVIDYRRAVAQEVAEQQEALERAMRFLGAKDTLRAEREDLRKRLTQAKQRLLPGGTGTLGAAALQERANALALEMGITVQSTQVLKEEAVDPFRKVGIRLTLSGELKPLAELIAGLEIGQQLSLNLVEVSRRGAVAGPKGPRMLTSTVEVSGFVQEGAKTEKVEGTGDGGGAADGVQPTVEGGQPTDVESSPTSTTVVEPTTTTFPIPTTTVPPITFPASTLPAMTVPPVTVPPTTLPPQVQPQLPMAQPRLHVPGPDLDELEDDE